MRRIKPSKTGNSNGCAMDSPRLATLRLVLDGLGPADHAPLAEMVSDYGVVSMLARWPWPPDLSLVDDLIARNQSDPTRGFAIRYGDELAGTIGSGPRVGFMLRRGFWGRGVLTEALTAVQKHAFETLGHEGLEAEVFDDNPASATVFRKCGWNEGARGQSMSLARGALVPDRAFTLARADWRAYAPLYLRTRNLVLRPIPDSDFPAFAAIASQVDVARMTASIPHPLTEEAAANWLEGRRWRGRAAYVAGIYRQDRLIGIAGLGGAPLSLMYAIDPAEAGRGFATEAAAAVIGDAVDRWGVDEIHADSFADNPASMRVLAKLGFERTRMSSGRSLARPDPGPVAEFRLTPAPHGFKRCGL